MLFCAFSRKPRFLLALSFGSRVPAPRNRRRITEIIKSKVPVRRGGTVTRVRAYWLFIAEINSDPNVSFLVVRVQHTCRLMTQHFRFRAGATLRYVALRNRPPQAPERLRWFSLICPTLVALCFSPWYLCFTFSTIILRHGTSLNTAKARLDMPIRGIQREERPFVLLKLVKDTADSGLLHA